MVVFTLFLKQKSESVDNTFSLFLFSKIFYRNSNILPFTYILGVSDKWIKKFEVIATQSPSWYDSTTPFTVTTFGLFMNSAMTNLTYSAASPGSGTTGGGSCGGGSGGGGGGSW